MDAGRHERPHLLEPVVEVAGADPRRPARRRRRSRATRSRSRVRLGRARARARAPARASCSALVATRAWNDSRPSVPLRTSPSTHSRTASSSSATVGRSCTRRRRRLVGRGAALERRPGEQPEHVPLVLAHPPADRGQLHRAGRPAEVAPRLHDAHHAPLEGAERLPPAQRLEVDRAPRRPPRRPPPAPRGWPRRRPAAASRTARPARRTTRGPPSGRRGGPAPSRGPPAGRRGRRAGCPSRRSPWTTPRLVAPAAGSPRASGTRARRPDAARRGRRAPSRYCATWSDGREPVDGVGGDAVDRRHRRADLRAEPRPRAIAHSSSRSSLRAIVSPVEPLDHHARRCRAPTRRRPPRTPGHRHARVAPRPGAAPPRSPCRSR